MKKLLYLLLLLPLFLISFDLPLTEVEAVADNNAAIPVVPNGSWGETYPFGNWSTQPVEIIKDGDNSCLKMAPTEWYPSMIGFKKDVSTDVIKVGEYQLLVDVKSSGIAAINKAKIDFILVYEGGDVKISDGVANLEDVNDSEWITLTFDFKIETSINSSYVNLDAYYWAEDTLDNNYVLIDNIRFIRKGDDTFKNIDKIYGGDFEFYHNEVETVSLAISHDFEIGKAMPVELNVSFKGSNSLSQIYANSDILVNYEISDETVLKADADGNLVAIALGTSKVKVIVDFYGTQLVSNEVSITVTDANIPDGAYIEHVGVSLDKEISLYDYSRIQISVKLSDGTFLKEGEYDVLLSTSNPDVCYIRSDKPYVLIGVGPGEATLYATVNYDGYTLVGSCDLNLESNNYLLNPSFEAEGYAWKMNGSAGGGFDNFKTNGFAKTGYGNIWLMAPVYWDGNVKPNSDVTISQKVSLDAGKYSFITYINRFYATGVNGVLNGVGGIVTLGAVALDINNNPVGAATEVEFDTSYGNNMYSKVSMVFDVLEASDYLIYIKVVGDPTLGLGMQIDDATLTKATYPTKITATIGEEAIEVDDLYKILVYAHYADGSKELLNSDLRFIFEDYKVACESKGFVVARTPGETDVLVKAQIFDQVYETTFTIKVNGSLVNEKPENNGCNAAITTSFSLLIPLSLMGVISYKKKKEEE